MPSAAATMRSMLSWTVGPRVPNAYMATSWQPPYPVWLALGTATVGTGLEQHGPCGV